MLPGSGAASVEAAAVGIAGDVMQQRRAGEVVVRRLEVGARVHQRGVRAMRRAQPLEVAGVERGDGLVEARVRFELRRPGGRARRGA